MIIAVDELMSCKTFNFYLKSLCNFDTQRFYISKLLLYNT